MNKTEQVSELDNFEVENSDDLTAVIGEDTTEDTPSKEPKEVDVEVVDATDGKAETKPTEKEQKPKRKSRTQRRIERVTRENADLREQLAEKAPNAEGTPKELDLDDYESYDEYLTAVKEQEQETKEEKPKVDAKELFEKGDLTDAMEYGAEDYDDFEEKIRATDLALTGEILGDVLESEIASDILYHLANNKDETRSIAGMTPRSRRKALFKIELSLENKPSGTVKKRVISKAPNPITPVDGNAPKAISLDDDDISYGEYEKEFNRQQAGHKSNGWS